MREVPDELIFSRTDALASGWSDSALSRAVRAGNITRLRRNQYALPHRVDDPRAVATAAARSCGGSVVSHRSALLLHGLPLLEQLPIRPDLTVAPNATGDVRRALLHRATLREEDVVIAAGVRTTSVARTLIDVARKVDTDTAVVSVDAALQRGLTDEDALASVYARCARWPGARRVPDVLRLADARAESPLESISRLAFQALNLPRAQLQAEVLDQSGSFVGRLDFYWDEFGVAGEADGRSKYDDRAVLIDEKVRQERLEDLGLIVVRWGWLDVRNRPDVLRQRIIRAFERGRQRDESAFPRAWSIRSPHPATTGEKDS